MQIVPGIPNQQAVKEGAKRGQCPLAVLVNLADALGTLADGAVQIAVRMSSTNWRKQQRSYGDPNAAPSAIVMPRWKRWFDVGLLALTAPVWVPLMALLAVTVKLCSRGPIFFRQERIGYQGRPFSLLKFRTMVPEAEQLHHEQHVIELMRSAGPMQKLDAAGDSRVFPVGRWLRATGLDELPQLINIGRGEMSLVGPRPCMPYEFEQYSEQERERCQTLPGLTGLWQVRGKNRTSFAEMIRLDLGYIAKPSILQDLGIIACTIPAMIRDARLNKAERKLSDFRAAQVRCHSQIPNGFTTKSSTTKERIHV